VPIRQILLVPHTHHDVGYTASPRIVDGLHAEIVGEVLRLARDHAATGPEQFRWTFEVARPVLAFLAGAAPERARELRRMAAEGRISVTGGYLNLTQLPSAAELDAGYELLARLQPPAWTCAPSSTATSTGSRGASSRRCGGPD
jgi:hypothetical protein